MKIILCSFSFVFLSVAIGWTAKCDQNIHVSDSMPPKESLNSKIDENKHVSITNVCSPVDGPAFVIRISNIKIGCNDYRSPHLSVDIWKTPGKVSEKTIRLPDKKIGMISKILDDGKRINAKSGTVSFGKVDENSSVVFEIDVEFEDGEKLHDTYRAEWCPDQNICP